MAASVAANGNSNGSGVIVTPPGPGGDVHGDPGVGGSGGPGQPTPPTPPG